MSMLVYKSHINYINSMQSNQVGEDKKSLNEDKHRLKLYIYGSCESDQYYHPSGGNESKRPICLSEVEQFKIEDENTQAKGQKIINNPLFRENIFQIACGALHTVVLTTEGKVYTFGCNDEGALGREGIEKVPVQVKLDGPMDMISAGDNHSVFANSQMGCIYFSGNYKFLRGEKMVEPIKVPEKYDLTAIDTRLKGNPIQKLVSGSNHTAILVSGKIFIRGQPQAHTVGRRINERHKLKSSLLFDSVGLTNVVNVWCGGYHTIAKVKKGDRSVYYAWGLNKHGQLGINSYEENQYPVQIRKIRGFNIKEVAAGTNFTIFLTESGELYGCGQNDDGQLGLGQNYVYVDSDSEEENNLAQQIKQKMNLDSQQDHQVKPQQLKKSQNQQIQPQKQKQQSIDIQGIEKAQDIQNIKDEPQAQALVMKKQSLPKPRLVEENIYIKSIKRIPLQEKIDQINAGSEFTLAWNSNNLYSWGFGMNYVLLNGQEEDELHPFKVKSKIINEQRIYQVAAGAQHVAYLSYASQQQPMKVEMSQNAKRLTLEAKEKLSRRKRTSKK